MKGTKRMLSLRLDHAKQNRSEVEVMVANTFLGRAIGLLLRKCLPDNLALLIVPCTSIHTIGMRFPIDVVFLDYEHKVLKIAENVRPYRFCFAPRGTKSVLEMAAGNATRTGIVLDATIAFD